MKRRIREPDRPTREGELTWLFKPQEIVRFTKRELVTNNMTVELNDNGKIVTTVLIESEVDELWLELSPALRMQLNKLGYEAAEKRNQKRAAFLRWVNGDNR